MSRLGPEHALLYRELRHSDLRSHPEYFGASLDEEASLSESTVADRLSHGVVFGAWLNGQLVGCAGLASREKVELRHKAILWGMFVRPDARGVGLGKLLLDAVIGHARPMYGEVLLTVVEGNETAASLYAAAGFEEYGRELGAIKIGDSYFGEILMRLPLAHR
ncbi:GNAT family N-acetyltransferase [Erythrobacter sp. SD-21]|uniref:GNAT family N-acetyltransferase n=1 Tax=Erythrobacter sp. SD-21 TaxID=161528 RepID=UPI000A01B27F|nr:GNAT family N-acetyltransferase [Erythrobacter sp. SD-21]